MIFQYLLKMNLYFIEDEIQIIKEEFKKPYDFKELFLKVPFYKFWIQNDYGENGLMLFIRYIGEMVGKDMISQKKNEKKKYEQLCIHFFQFLQQKTPGICQKICQDTSVLQTNILFYALEYHLFDFLTVLIESNCCPINLVTNDNVTFLMRAIVKKQKHIVQLLIHPQRIHKIRLHHIGPNGNTAFILLTYIGWFDICIDLLSYYHMILPNHTNQNGCSALTLTIVYDDSEKNESMNTLSNEFALRLIDYIDTSKSYVNKHDGMDILLYAIVKEKVEIATKLIEKGYKPDVIASNGSTSLMLAIVKKMKDVAWKIYQTGYSNPTYVNECGIDAFMLCCSDSDFQDLAYELIQNHPIEVDTINEVGQNALIWACLHNMRDVAYLLITKYPHICGINQIDHQGDSALLFACNNNMETVMFHLLQLVTKDVLTHKNHRNISPLDCCIHNKNHTFVKYIQKRIAFFEEFEQNSI